MENRNLRKERIGVVSSSKMEKSIVVSEVKRVKHPMYGKVRIKNEKVCCSRRTERLQRRRYRKDNGNTSYE